MSSNKNKIKLVEVIADSELGGGPKHVLGILENIDQDKFEVFLVCPSGYLSTEAKKIRGISIINFNPRSKFDLIAIILLKGIFQKIQSHGNPFGPMIIHSHGPRAGLMARLVSPFGVKKVHTEHLLNENYHLKSKPNELIQKWITKRLDRKTDLIIAVSSSVKNYLVKNGHSKKNNITIIPNAIILDKVPHKKINTVNLSPVIGTIGNLNPQKGQTYLIEAMKKIVNKYPLATLEIIGSGEEKTKLLQKARELGLEKSVAFLGKKADIKKFMKNWDVFVLPSISETFGISILEAMNAGIPVIASNIGGISDIVINKKNGLLVESKKPSTIANAVFEILSHPVLAAKLKREGGLRVKDFDWKVIIKRLEEGLEKVVSN